MKKTGSDTHKPRLLFKGVLLFILAGLNYLTFSFFFSTVTDDITYDNESYLDTRLPELAAEGEYAELYEYLNLYDLYDEKYKDFWDVTEAWHLYCRYLAAKDAAQNPALAGEAGSYLTGDDYRRQADDLLARLKEFPADQENRTAREAVEKISDFGSTPASSVEE